MINDKREKHQFEFTESNMIDELFKFKSALCTSYDMFIPNCYTSHDNEADAFAIRRSGICDEFEIKLSRADFLNDAKKIVQWRDCEYWSRTIPESKNGKIDTEWMNETRKLSCKEKKKLVAPWQKLKYNALQDGDMAANYFWYVVKSGIAHIDEFPEFAGVIFVNEYGDFNRVRMPKKLHKNKIEPEEKYRLAKKLAYRFWDYRVGAR